MNKQKIIEQLRDDTKYYGELGKMYLSASDVGNLLTNPAKFKHQEQTLPMILGRYFHTAVLEPDKLQDFHIVDASTRNTKDYKQAVGMSEDSYLLLEKEVIELDQLVSKLKSNMDLHDMIYAKGNLYEEPGLGEIMGEQWKGKADIITDTHVIDLKTTSDITKFRYSAKTYNYDSQSYVYNKLFGKPVMFIVICKKTQQIGVYDASQEFMLEGETKVMRAVQQYRKFYGPDASEDVNNYYTREEL